MLAASAAISFTESRCGLDRHLGVIFPRFVPRHPPLPIAPKLPPPNIVPVYRRTAT
jgi:hypothetical protein